MAKKAAEKKPEYAFGVKSGNKTETFEFVKPAFIFKGIRYQVADLFEGENLQQEHAAMAAELVKIKSGVIQKLN